MGNTQFNFEINLEIAGKTYADITYCSFLRAPLVKQCGIAIMKIYLSQVITRQMVADVDTNNYPKMKLKVYLKDEITKKKTKELFQQQVNCINVLPDGPIKFQEERMHVTLVLVHFILQYISNNNTYNVIEEDTTAYAALSKFEGWLLSTYNAGFLPHHIGVDSSTYIYEQMLIRAPNDLNVPTFIINNYKPNKSFGFYFFDSFYVSDDRQVDIVNHFINFSSKHAFKKVDVYEYVDQKLNVNFIKNCNMSDLKEKFLTPIGNRKIFRHREIAFDHEKKPTNCTMPRECPTGLVPIPLVGDRQIKNIPDIKRSSIQWPSSAITNIYCPDEVELGEERFEKGQQFMSNFKGIQFFEITNSLPDFPQFGEIYNLEEENKKNYVLTPINICNIFIRKNMKENDLYHTAKTLMFRFPND